MDSFYFPKIFDGHYDIFTTRLEGGVELKAASLRDSFFDSALAAFYENASKILASMKVAEIIDTLDAASRLFLDPKNPDRIAAIEAISAVTGFSGESVAKSIDLEFSSSLKPQMAAALKNEFGRAEILDGFVVDRKNKRRSRALPAGPVFAVSSSNIPALPHLSVMRSFLTKNSVAVKTSFEEPIFTPLYMKAFRAMKSPLAECAAIACYKSSENPGVTERFIAASNIVIAYGGVEAENYFASRVKYPKKLIMHPHRLGFGVIAEGYAAGKSSKEPDRLALSIATDVSTFEQRACLAPHVYFYCTKGNEPADVFIKRLVAALEKSEKILPPARLSGPAAFARRSFIEAANFESGVRGVYETKSGRSAVIDACASKFPVSPLDRVIYIARYESAPEVIGVLRPVADYLQNAALSVLPEDEKFWLDALCGLGVSRICRPGEMPAPTMMWRHDGIGALIEMTRFCDVEKY